MNTIYYVNGSIVGELVWQKLKKDRWHWSSLIGKDIWYSIWCTFYWILTLIWSYFIICIIRWDMLWLTDILLMILWYESVLAFNCIIVHDIANKCTILCHYLICVVYNKVVEFCRVTLFSQSKTGSKQKKKQQAHFSLTRKNTLLLKLRLVSLL